MPNITGNARKYSISNNVFDELGAKVKFYLRKIEVDMLENKRDTGNKEQD